MRPFTAKQAEALLMRYGFVLVSQKGSHRKWRHTAKGLLAIVPGHKGRTLPLGTLQSIMKSAEIPESEWK